MLESWHGAILFTLTLLLGQTESNLIANANKTIHATRHTVSIVGVGKMPCNFFSMFTKFGATTYMEIHILGISFPFSPTYGWKIIPIVTYDC